MSLRFDSRLTRWALSRTRFRYRRLVWRAPKASIGFGTRLRAFRRFLNRSDSHTPGTSRLAIRKCNTHTRHTARLVEKTLAWPLAARMQS